MLGAGRVHRRPFDIVGIAAGAGHRRGDARQHFGLVDAHLIFAMERRGADEGVDAALLRRLDGIGADVDVLGLRAGKPADHRILRPPRDLLDALEIALARDGKSCLDDVDAHLVEQLGDLDLLLEGHGGAGALLAVAQGGVENNDTPTSWGLVGAHLLVLNSWPSSLARLASRLNYRGFLLPSPERRPRSIGESEGAQGRLRRSSVRQMCAREVAAGKPVPAPNPISPRVACIDNLAIARVSRAPRNIVRSLRRGKSAHKARQVLIRIRRSRQ